MSEADPAASSASESSVSSDDAASEPSARSDEAAADPSEAQEAAPSAEPKPRSMAVRIVLLLLLAVSVGTFAFDFSARRRRDQAYQFLDEAFPEGDEDVFADPDNLRVLGPPEVRKKLGPPASTEVLNSMLITDTFRFGGVFYSHELQVYYFGMENVEMMHSIEKVSRFRVGK